MFEARVPSLPSSDCEWDGNFELGFLLGCKTHGSGRDRLEISHLLYVDDILVFCKAFRIRWCTLADF